MRVKYRKSGGFAGISLKREFDTDTMTPVEADELLKLINAARAAQLQTHPRTEGMFDQFCYAITIEENGQTTTVNFDDGSPISQPVWDLVRHLGKGSPWG